MKLFVKFLILAYSFFIATNISAQVKDTLYFSKTDSTKPDRTYVDGDTVKIVTSIKKPAQFPGGQQGWGKYLTRNLNQNVPIEKGAPRGRYTVIAEFVVDTTGKLYSIRILKDPGYGTAEEALRILWKSPKWEPAILNGKKVKFRQKQSITFMIDGY